MPTRVEAQENKRIEGELKFGIRQLPGESGTRTRGNGSIPAHAVESAFRAYEIKWGNASELRSSDALTYAENFGDCYRLGTEILSGTVAPF
jgi:hypothetical protein